MTEERGEAGKGTAEKVEVGRWAPDGMPNVRDIAQRVVGISPAPVDTRGGKARIRSLVDSLAQRSGAEGAAALKSLADGASKGLGWNPNGIPQHRGDDAGLESEREAREIKGYPDTYELVTFWKSESERDAAEAWLEEALPNAVGRIEDGYGGFASSPGELALHS